MRGLSHTGAVDRQQLASFHLFSHPPQPEKMTMNIEQVVDQRYNYPALDDVWEGVTKTWWEHQRKLLTITNNQD